MRPLIWRVPGYEAFTAAWAEAWRAALNASETYRRAAASWEGAVALVMHADRAAGIAERRAVFVDLWRGTCRASRVATRDDLAAAAFVFEAGAAAWRELLAARLSPVMALMSGQLALTRGSLFTLMPYAAAADALMATAARVQSTFPEAHRGPPPPDGPG